MLKTTQKKPDALEMGVLNLANEMLHKLRKKQRSGWHGWQDDKFQMEYLSERIGTHLERAFFNGEPEDYVDVCNFIMFRHWWLRKKRMDQPLFLEKTNK